MVASATMKVKRRLLDNSLTLLYCRGMLDIHRLHVLKTVVDVGSMKAAAAALGYTSSAISQSVAALERDTQTALFEKAGRGVRPTQAGLLLARHASAVIARVHEAEEALEALRAGQAGRLQVAAFPTAGATLVPDALALFRAAHPHVAVDLDVVEPDDAVERLRAGRIDLAVVEDEAASAPDDNDDDVIWTHLLDDSYRAVVPRTHPLAARRHIKLGDLAEDSWIGMSTDVCDWLVTISRACGRAGFSPDITIEADDFSTILGFVAAGLGVSMVPLLGLDSVPDSACVLPLDTDPPVRHLYTVTRASIADQTAVTSIQDALRQSAHSYAG